MFVFYDTQDRSMYKRVYYVHFSYAMLARSGLSVNSLAAKTCCSLLHYGIRNTIPFPWILHLSFSIKLI